jgi:hypothetical protein
MQDVANALRALVAEVRPQLEAITDTAASAPRAAGKWSRKEILGHLVDSACNNHQRFIRAQLSGALTFPGYAQEEWVARQGYRDRPWAEIVTLWALLNGHVAHAAERIPAADLLKPCHVGGDSAVTLEFLVRDYVTHHRHHLAQIFS